MSGLKIGLVASGSDESKQLASLLENNGAEIVHNIVPEKISDEHVEDESLHVWLLNVDDDSWHDAIDHLLDESETPVYFSEPGTLAKQSHPEYWCTNLLTRLYEITGLEQEPEEPPEVLVEPEPVPEPVENEKPAEEAASEQTQNSVTEEAETPLSKSLDDLEVSTVDLPSDIAAELVSELESISPVLSEDISNTTQAEKATQAEKTSEAVSETTAEESSDTTSSEENIDVEVESLALEDDELELEPAVVQSDDEVLSSEQEETEVEEFGELDASSIEMESLEFELAEASTDSVQAESLEHESSEIELLDLDLDTNESSSESTQVVEVIEPESITQDHIEVEASEEMALDQDFELALDEEFESSNTEQERDAKSLDLTLEEESNNNELDINLESSELSLEIDEQETATTSTGRATFQIDDEEEESGQESVESETTATADDNVDDNSGDFGGLSLEAMDDHQPTSGKANFLGEDFDEPESVVEVIEPENEIKEQAEEPIEDSGLTLEAMDSDEQQTDWLSQQAEPSQDLEQPEIATGEQVEEQASTQTTDEELEFSFELEPMDDSTGDIESDDAFGQASGEDEHSHEHVEASKDVSVSEESEIAEDESFELSLEAETDASEIEMPEIEMSEAMDIENLEPITDTNDIDTVEQQDLLNAELSAGLELDEDIIRDIARDALDDQQEVPVVEQTTTELEPPVVKAEQELPEQYVPEQEVAEDVALDNEPLPEPQIEEELGAITEETTALANDALAQQNVVDNEAIEFEIPMLDETAGDVEFEEKIEPVVTTRFTPCWVIGASLGGPAAVKRFLNCIPADINAGFIIAQHIDENFLPVLAEILTNSSQFTVTVAQGSNDIEPGKVYLAPLKGKLVLLQDGSMLVDHSQKWSAPYSPCINDVIESVSQVYGDLSGAIIFSGMGEDGLNGARKMRQQGGQVWAQSTETCANASMPESVINNGETDFIGTPEQLADKLVRELKGTTSLAG